MTEANWLQTVDLKAAYLICLHQVCGCSFCERLRIIRARVAIAVNPPKIGRMTAEEKETAVFWFCDDCETFLNIQDGFSTDSGTWVCTECGYDNNVTEENIL